MVLSDEVITARARGMPGSRWHRHMRWLGVKKAKVKEVEPDGHSEATRGHMLYLHELASVDIQRLSPNSYPNRVGHGGVDTCG
jgi:hypothetical protein